MRRLLLLAAVVALNAAALAQTPQLRPTQADPIVRLLSDLESALLSGRPEDLTPLAAPTLRADDRARFTRAVEGGNVTTATLRERARRPLENGLSEVLAEVFVSHDRRGRIATWSITTRARPGSTDRAELVALEELNAVDGLIRLALNPEKQFAVHDLSFTAQDLVLKMASGTAFVAESDGGVTGLVLRGKGEAHFSPAPAAEQGQLRRFSGRPALITEFDALFVRLNSAEFATRVAEQSLQPSAVDALELRRADEIFNDRSPRAYNLDLRDLASERWSLEPAVGALVVEFRSRRFGWLTYARSPSEAEDISLFDRARGRNISVYASPDTLAKRGEFFSEDEDAAYDVEHYDLDLRFEPLRSWVTGRAQVRLRTRDQPVNTLTMKLGEPLTISSVSSPELGPLLTLRIVRQNNFIVSLPRAVPPRTEIVLEITYSGRLPPQPLDREAIAVDGTLAPQGQGQSAQGSQDELVVLAEPRFMYSNRTQWYPQAPTSDYATAAMRITVPSEYQLVASGTFVKTSLSPITAEPEKGEQRFMRTVEYRADRPVRYLSCVISRFVPVGRAAAAGVNLEVVATPRQLRANRQMPNRVADILKFYVARLGEAPYPDFTLAAIDDNLPGGHSPPYFAVLHQPLPTTPYSWANDPVAFEGYPHFFLAHEIAHQWWGQGVGWKNYHEQWLSEGLAQYSALLYAAQDRGPDALKNLLLQMRDSALELNDQGPIYLGYRLGHLQNDGRIFRAITYNKSAVVLHMLRRVVGDDAFFRGLQRFYRDFRFKKAGTDDLRQVFEAESKLPLRRFFQKWIMGATLPHLRVTTRIDDSGSAAIVHVEQIDEVFDVPVTVAVQLADGTNEEVTLVITEATSEHRVVLKGPVRKIEVKDDLGLATIKK
jgi:hypothetical protein